jgi:PhoH-like ATPase
MKDIFEPVNLTVSDSFIDNLFIEKTNELKNIHKKFHYESGTFLILQSEKKKNKKALAYITIDELKLIDPKLAYGSIIPKDSKQLMFAAAMQEIDFSVIVCFGAAGTGKTTLAIAKAIQDYFTHKKKIYLTKPTHMVQSHTNQVFGPVPGDVDEKYTPYIKSFEIVLKKILGNESKHYLDMMKKRKDLEFVPVEYTRGCTYENCTFIIDEVQNMTWHELKTTMSRIGENSQLLLLGDLNQIDADFGLKDSGIYQLITSQTFDESDITSTIKLTKQYRGPIPDLVYHVDKEQKGTHELSNEF